MICGLCEERIIAGDSRGYDYRLEMKPNHLDCLLDWVKKNGGKQSPVKGNNDRMGAGRSDEAAAVCSLR